MSRVWRATLTLLQVVIKTPQQPTPKSGQKAGADSGNRRQNTPFRRVREEEVEVHHQLADNSFEAKVIALSACRAKPVPSPPCFRVTMTTKKKRKTTRRLNSITGRRAPASATAAEATGAGSGDAAATGVDSGAEAEIAVDSGAAVEATGVDSAAGAAETVVDSADVAAEIGEVSVVAVVTVADSGVAVAVTGVDAEGSVAVPTRTGSRRAARA